MDKNTCVFKLNRLFLLTGMALVLVGCDEFDGGEFRKYLPITQKNSSKLFSERVWFSCAMAGFAFSNTYEPSDIDLPKGFENWAQLPINDHVEENSIVYRIMASQSRCWTSELVHLTGHSSIFEFVENIDGAFSRKGSILLIFDSKQNRIFIMDG